MQPNDSSAACVRCSVSFELLKDALGCIAMKFLGGVEVNLSLELWPLAEALPSKKNDLCLDAFELGRGSFLWGIVQIPNVEVEIGLVAPTVAVIAVLSIRLEAVAQSGRHALTRNTDVDKNSSTRGDVKLRNGLGRRSDEMWSAVWRDDGVTAGSEPKLIALCSLERH